MAVRFPYSMLLLPFLAVLLSGAQGFRQIRSSSYELHVSNFNYGYQSRAISVSCNRQRNSIHMRGDDSLWKDPYSSSTTLLSPSPSSSASASLTASTTEDPKALWLARGMLVVVSAFYGTNFGCVKILDDALDPSFAALARFSLAALVFLPYVLKVYKTNRKLVLSGLECGAYNALGYWTQAIALTTAPASTVAFICSLAVVVVPLLDMVFPKKESSASTQQEGGNSKLDVIAKFLPAVLATIGVGALELGGSVVPGIGDLWAIGQPLFFGLAFWRAADVMHASKGPGEAQAFTGSMMISVALYSLLWTMQSFVAPHFGDWTALSSAFHSQIAAFDNWQIMAALLWTGIVTTALTAFGENMAMRTLSAAESTVIFSTEPLWGTAFAAMALGEQVGWNTVVGAIFILSACVWSSLGPAVPLAAAQAAFASEEFAMAEGFEEMVENVGINWSQLLEKFGGGQ